MWLRQSTASQEILLGRFVDSTLSFASRMLWSWRVAALDGAKLSATMVGAQLLNKLLSARQTRFRGARDGSCDFWVFKLVGRCGMQLKVFDPVVSDVPVSVVYNFVARKRPAEVLAHDKPMFKDVAALRGVRVATILDHDVSMRGKRFSSFPKPVAGTSPIMSMNKGDLYAAGSQSPFGRTAWDK